MFSSKWICRRVRRMESMSVDHSNSRWTKELSQWKRWRRTARDGDRQELFYSSTPSFPLFPRTSDMFESVGHRKWKSRMSKWIRRTLVWNGSTDIFDALQWSSRRRMFISSSIHWSILDIVEREYDSDSIVHSFSFSLWHIRESRWMSSMVEMSRRSTSVFNWSMCRPKLVERWWMGLSGCFGWIRMVDTPTGSNTSTRISSQFL